MPLPDPDSLPKTIPAEVARQPGFVLEPNDWIDCDDEPIPSSVNPKSSRTQDSRYYKRGRDHRTIARQNEPADELLNHPDGIDWV